jgi:hypothetical protein
MKTNKLTGNGRNCGCRAENQVTEHKAIVDSYYRQSSGEKTLPKMKGYPEMLMKIKDRVCAVWG